MVNMLRDRCLVVLCGLVLILLAGGCAEDDAMVAPGPLATCADYAAAAHFLSAISTKSQAISHQDGYLYTVYHQNPEFSVVDVSDPSHPEVVATIDDLPGEPFPMVTTDGWAVVSARYDGQNGGRLVAIDITDPRDPTVSLTRDDCYPGPMAFTDSTLVIVVESDDLDGEADLLVLTHPDTGELVEIGRLHLERRVADIAIEENYAYLTFEGLRVVDLSDPAAPVLIGDLHNSRGSGALAVRDGYAFANDGYGLRSFDVRDPHAPAELDNIGVSTLVDSRGMALYGQYALICERGWGLFIIDTARPDDLRQVAELGVVGPAYQVVQADGYAFVSASNWGLSVYELGDPPQAEGLVTRNAIGGPNGWYVTAAKMTGDHLVAGSGYGQLWVVDMTEPTDPVVVETTSSQYDQLYDLATSDSLVAVVGQSLPTQIYRLAADGGLSLISEVFVSGVTAVFHGNYLYVAEDDLYAIDLTDPTVPSITTRIEGYRIEGLKLDGDVLWTFNGVNGLDFVSFSLADPAAPAYLGEIHVPRSSPLSDSGQAGYFTLNAGYLYFSRDHDVAVIDIMDPASPTLVNSIPAPRLNRVGGLIASGNDLFVLDGGWHIFDISDPLDVVGKAYVDASGSAIIPHDGYLVSCGGQGLEVWLPQCE